jgi:small nuclear ribonucleoprotein (snRNP)-like protein
MDAPKRKEPNFLYKLLGQRINVVLNTDDEIPGVLLGYSRYELLVKVDEIEEEAAAKTVLIMKHAINVIIPEEDGVFDRKPEEEKSAYAGDNTQPAIDVMK